MRRFKSPSHDAQCPQGLRLALHKHWHRTAIIGVRTQQRIVNLPPVGKPCAKCACLRILPAAAEKSQQTYQVSRTWVLLPVSYQLPNKPILKRHLHFIKCCSAANVKQTGRWTPEMALSACCNCGVIGQRICHKILSAHTVQ